jgi:hypothetical protein
MNYGRLVAAAVAGTIVDAVYGFLAYGTALRGEFSRYPNVYRAPDTGPAYLPVMFMKGGAAGLPKAYASVRSLVRSWARSSARSVTGR